MARTPLQVLEDDVREEARQQALNHSYSLLDEKSKGDLAGIASTFTADPSRLASKSGQDSEPVVAEEGAA